LGCGQRTDQGLDLRDGDRHVGCWQGLKTEGGAEGVGRATTRTVVIASIAILILNFFLSKALPSSLSQ